MEDEQGPSQEATSPCHLWRMPQEIIDIIIDMAYGHNSRDGVKTIRAWNEEEIRRKKHGGHEYEMKPFKPKVDDFIVSKAFFVLAAKAWFGEQTWLDGPTYKSSFFRGRLFYEYGTYIQRPADSRLEAIVSCPRLHTAHIDVSPDHFDELILSDNSPASDPKLPWLDQLGPSDFEKLRITAAIKKASGLRHFSLRETACYFPKNDDEREMWHTNVKALEQYLRPFVTGQKKTPEDDYPLDRPRPLYSGSRVCWETSELLPEDFWKERTRNGGPFQVATRYRGLEERKEKAKELGSIFLERMAKLQMDPEELLQLVMEVKKKQEQEQATNRATEDDSELINSAIRERESAPSTPPPHEVSKIEDQECQPSPSTADVSMAESNDAEEDRSQATAGDSQQSMPHMCEQSTGNDRPEQATTALRVALAA